MPLIEEWRPVADWGAHYAVSSLGRVYSSHKKGRILKPRARESRHLYVVLQHNGIRRNYFVHRLVALAFLGPSDLPVIRHLDGNPFNNCVENLAWGTASENTQDSLRHGTNFNSNKTHCNYGHEFTKSNTYRSADGSRSCKICRREAFRRWKATQ